jgi:hypothetical protein
LYPAVKLWEKIHTTHADCEDRFLELLDQLN